MIGKAFALYALWQAFRHRRGIRLGTWPPRWLEVRISGAYEGTFQRRKRVRAVTALPSGSYYIEWDDRSGSLVV